MFNNRAIHTSAKEDKLMDFTAFIVTERGATFQTGDRLTLDPDQLYRRAHCARQIPHPGQDHDRIAVELIAPCMFKRGELVDVIHIDQARKLRALVALAPIGSAAALATLNEVAAALAHGHEVDEERTRAAAEAERERADRIAAAKAAQRPAVVRAAPVKPAGLAADATLEIEDEGGGLELVAVLGVDPMNSSGGYRRF